MISSKKAQNLKAIVLVILIICSLFGAGAYGYFKGNTSLTPTSASTSTSTSATNPVPSSNSNYNNLKKQVNELSEQVKSNPNDIQLQESLGNTYYDLGTAAKNAAPNEALDDFVQATKYYQNVLQTKQDINILTDLGTAAFYSRQNDLAEKSYQEALKVNPNFQQALFDYGIFLYQIKKDYSTAIRLWQTALDKDPNGPNAGQLKNLISQAKGI